MAVGGPDDGGDVVWEIVGDCVILFIVARTRLDRYAVLRGQFGHSREVKIVLDRREGERRALGPTFSGVNLRRVERRQTQTDLRKLGWSVIETDELDVLTP